MFKKSLEVIEREGVKKMNLLLMEGEEIKQVKVLGNDLIAFTESRVLCIDFSLKDNSRTYVGIPFRHILGVGIRKGIGLSLSKYVIIYTAAGQIIVDSFSMELCSIVAKAIAAKTV